MVSAWIGAFYERPDFRRSQSAINALDVIKWWESRRLFFNLAVGCAGLVTGILLITCAVTSDSFVGEPIGMTDGPLLGVFSIIPYAIIANICYTGGWVAELLVRMAGKVESAGAFGLKAFRFGVTFSILITLCPAALSWLAFAVALLRGQKHGPLGE
jgi:hypothetical protein